MKTLNKAERMSVNGGAAHYHWYCYYGTHQYYSVARTKSSAIIWRDRHNVKYHSGLPKAKLSAACNNSCGPIYSNT